MIWSVCIFGFFRNRYGFPKLFIIRPLQIIIDIHAYHYVRDVFLSNERIGIQQNKTIIFREGIEKRLCQCMLNIKIAID